MSKIKLVGICGPKRSGKNAAGQALAELGWYRHELSALLRNLMEAFLGKELSDEEYERTKDTLLCGDRTYRDFYVSIGQALRKLVDPDIHQNYMDKIISDVIQPVYTPNVRMDNEAKYIRDRGGIIIEVRRPGYHYDPSEPTEAGISSCLIDHVVVNSGSESDLKLMIRGLVDETN